MSGKAELIASLDTGECLLEKYLGRDNANKCYELAPDEVQLAANYGLQKYESELAETLRQTNLPVRDTIHKKITRVWSGVDGLIDKLEKVGYIGRSEGSEEKKRREEYLSHPKAEGGNPDNPMEDPLGEDMDEEIIEEVRNRPFLWNNNLLEYRDGMGKTHAWKEMALKLDRPVHYVKRRWKNLRDGMVKSIRRNNQALQNGDGESPLSLHKCRYYDKLIFLMEIQGNPRVKTLLPYVPPLDIRPEHDDPLTVYGGNNTAHPLSNQQSIQDQHSKIGNNKHRAKKRKIKIVEPYPIDQEDDIFEDVLEPSPGVSSVNPPSPTHSNEGGETPSKNSNWFFCQSLVETLNSLPKKKNRLARVKIQEVLLKIEFDGSV